MSTSEKFKLYTVSLTERYETLVWASSRQKAIDAVREHGGSDPIWRQVAAQPVKDGSQESAAIDTERNQQRVRQTRTNRLITTLKDRDQQTRVTCGDRWLVWYENQWQVMECRYRQRNSKTDHRH